MKGCVGAFRMLLHMTLANVNGLILLDSWTRCAETTGEAEDMLKAVMLAATQQLTSRAEWQPDLHDAVQCISMWIKLPAAANIFTVVLNVAFQMDFS